MGLRIFLTGASGYLGSLLAARMAELPEVESITGMASTAPSGALPLKMSFLRMDMRSPELGAAMAGHDIVVHTACVVLWPARMSVRQRDDINFNGIRNVAQAAKDNRVRRFIHASSMAAYDPGLGKGKSDVNEEFPLGPGTSPFYYWNAKAAAERTLADVLGGTDMVVTMFRPIYIIGPRNKATVANYRKNAVNISGHNPRRQFVHEEDVAAAFILPLRKEMPGAFNVVPNDFMRMNEIWPLVGAQKVPTIPLWLACAVTWVRWRFLGAAIHTSWVKDMLVDFTGANDKLKQAGWQPRYNSLQAFKTAL